MREFSHAPAKRGSVPLLIGLAGPSGGGKTFSALRLARGITRVTGGRIYVIDTEAERATHYAPREGEQASASTFDFEHVPFSPPFSSDDYSAVFRYVAAQRDVGAIVVDSMSHEHEGEGGHLEHHSEEKERIAKLWKVSAKVADMSAWDEPKKRRRAMINTILALKIPAILCFRAKKKLKIEKGKDPEQRGWMPVAGEELVFELALRCLLLPNADGVPTWTSSYDGENETMKRPGQFRDLLREGRQLTEEIGEALACWSQGAALPQPIAAVLEQIEAARTVADLEAARDALALIKRHRSEPRPALESAIAALNAKKSQIGVLAPGAETTTREPGDETP